MWQLRALSALILMSLCCPAQLQNAQGPHDVDANGQIDLDKRAAKPAELPWTVKIYRSRWIKDKDKFGWRDVHSCNGALINPKVVLVMVHCVWDVTLSELTVRAGEWDTESDSEINHVQDRNISAIEYHSQVNPWEHKNIVGILILSSPLEVSNNIGIICVPRENERYDGSRCVVSGWGKRPFGPDGTGLKRVNLPIIPPDECEKNYVDYFALRPYSLPYDPQSICGGSSQHPDMNEDESGNLLICPIVDSGTPPQYVLVGLQITNFGQSGKPYLPSTFADVPAARNWIDEKMRGMEINPLEYTACSS